MKLLTLLTITIGLLVLAKMSKSLVIQATVGIFLSSSVLLISELFGFSNFRCKYDFYECCDTHFVYNKSLLFESLEKDVYGQHIAIEMVLKAVSDHIEKKSNKPLVMSFHGWTGTGKTYVFKKIVESIFSRKNSSSFVHLWNCQSQFSGKNKVIEHSKQINKWVISNVSERCDKSVFVFDEADHMPATLLDTLVPFLNEKTYNGIDFSKTIFIFLSNVGGEEIAEELYTRLMRGFKRNEVNLNDLNKAVMKMAILGKTGFENSTIIKNKLIDVLVPFFPLELEHVGLCVKDSIKKLDISLDVYPKVMNEIKKNLNWIPNHFDYKPIFSESGCKKIDNLVKTELGHLLKD